MSISIPISFSLLLSFVVFSNSLRIFLQKNRDNKKLEDDDGDDDDNDNENEEEYEGEK